MWGGQGTTLNEMVKEGLPEEVTVESSMTRKCQMGEEFGRTISRRGKMQVQRPWGRYELYMLQKYRGNLVAQLVKNLPAMQETWVRSLSWEDPLEKGHPLQYSDLENSVDCIVHGVTKSQTWLSDFHFHLVCTGEQEEKLDPFELHWSQWTFWILFQDSGISWESLCLGVMLSESCDDGYTFYNIIEFFEGWLNLRNEPIIKKDF